MEISLSHSLSYTTKGDVPVALVARSLLANERLVHESVRILVALAHGARVQKITVRVGHVSNASPLRQVLVAATYLTFQQDLHREVPALVELLTGKDVPDSLDTLVTVLVLIVAITVIDAAVERLFPGKSVKKLERELNKQLDALAQISHVSRDEIKSVLDHRLSEGKRRSLFRRAHDFFLPAKLEPGVEIHGPKGIEMAADAIDEVPTELQLEQEDKRNVYELNDVPIEIHRADVDFQKHGWLAIVAEVSEKRKRLILPPDVNPSELYGETTIRGDVSVVEERQLDGEYSVKEYHLLRLHSPSTG